MNNHEKLYNSGLKHRAIIVYLYLESRANKDGHCWPSARLIAKELGLSTKTVYRAIDDLRNAGLIKTIQRKRKSGAWSSLLYCLESTQLAK